MSRPIDDILNFRSDISPFLVHLTKKTEKNTASEILKLILQEQKLQASSNPVSDARFGILTSNWVEDKLKRNFGAICFTETPLNEIHCLLEIEYRNVNLEPYGLVFIKENLQATGVSPVFYINNYPDDKNAVMQKLCDALIDNEEAAKILPLFANTGIKLTSPYSQIKQTEKVDFMWEREWRYPAVYNNLVIKDCDVFIGLCPHEEIDEFELRSSQIFGKKIGFIDPKRNMKWYATKLIERRKELGMKHEVV